MPNQQDKALRDKLARDRHRPSYHFLPPKHWMNDPNGLIQFKGKYHLFYQHNPFGPLWGNMTWGHAVSRDLVRWKHMPHALHPDQPYDDGGVYTGCAVDNAGVPTIVYTGVRPECQCIATSRDMVTWTKHPRNPVVPTPPEGMEVTGFRDPDVWREGKTWYMVVGSGIKGVGGAILLYKSKDLVQWDYVRPAYVGKVDETGAMWECPNFFSLGRRHVLIVSTLGRAIYFVGTWRNERFTPQAQGELDQGGSFYAPQVFRDNTGRRVMFGWLRERRSNAAQTAARWSGVQSLPRVLTLGRGGKLAFAPAPEVDSLRGRHQQWAQLDIGPDALLPIECARGDGIEIAAELDLGRAARCGLSVRRSPKAAEETRIIYDSEAEQLIVDCERSSKSKAAAKGTHATAFRLDKREPLKLRVFLDGTVVEVYANGRACLTSRIYPTQANSVGAALFAERGAAKLKRLDVWQMRSIW